MLRSLTDCTCSVHWLHMLRSLTAHAPFTHWLHMLRSLTDCTCSVHSLAAHALFTHRSCNRTDGGPRFCLSTQTEVCPQKRERTPSAQPSKSDSTKWLFAAMSWCPTRWSLRSPVLWPANVRETLYLVLALEGFLNKPQFYVLFSIAASV